MSKITGFLRFNWVILTIIFIALALRINGLLFQSLWYDELMAVKESDPSFTFSDLLVKLKADDIQPPLFFLIQKCLFYLFGYSELTGRLTSAIIGTIGVVAVYNLGKAVKDKNLGLLSAFILAINLFHIRYSQEIRPYSFSFLFATLSFTYFIELLKLPAGRTAVLYVVFTLLLLYTHYYSLFVVASQATLGLLFWLIEKDRVEKRKLLTFLIFRALAIGICYLPWASVLQITKLYRSIWIPMPSTNFVSEYVTEFFGSFNILNPLLELLISAFVLAVFFRNSNDKKEVNVKSDPHLRLLLIAGIWIGFVFLIPYVYSLVKAPMLQPRYTIVALPAIIIIVAFAFELITNTVIKWFGVILFVCLSLFNLFVAANYYKSVTRTQFREMTQYVVKKNERNYPINNEYTSWQQSFYLNMFNSKAKIFKVNKELFVDSVLHAGSRVYGLTGFWLVGAQGEKMLEENKRRALDNSYRLLDSAQFYDAWAQLFVSKSYYDTHYTILNYTDFLLTPNVTVLNNDKLLAIWHGETVSKRITIEKGMYQVVISAKGSSALSVFPHVIVSFDNKTVGEYLVGKELKEKSFILDMPMRTNSAITLNFDNDFEGKEEDRNLFLSSVMLKRVE